MANPYPAKFEDDQGNTRLEGQIDFTDSGNQPGTPFNGGTITEALTVQSPSQPALVLEAPGHDSDTLFVSGVDDLAHGSWSVSAQGTMTLDGQITVGGIYDYVALYVLAKTAQTVPVLQAFTDAGTAFQLDKLGRPVLAVHTAPADGDLAAGECALWFDQTNGAGNTKLMVKGKSADGTVKTAAILLA